MTQGGVTHKANDAVGFHAHHRHMQKTLLTLSELARRIENMVRVGVVHAVDNDNKKLKVKTGDNITNWLPWPADISRNHVTWAAFKPGTQVVLLCESGDLANALICNTIYNLNNPAPSSDPDADVIQFSDGALFSYNVETHALDATLPYGATTNVESRAGFNIIGDLSVVGNINSTENISASKDIDAGGDVSDATRSMTGDRAIFNSHTNDGKPLSSAKQ